MVHIGSKIKERVEALGLGATRFGELLNKSRENVYDIYGRETVDTGLLFSCCRVLEFDFFSFFYDDEPLKTLKLEQANQYKIVIDDLNGQIDSLASQIKLQNELIFTQAENNKHITLLLKERDAELAQLKSLN